MNRSSVQRSLTHHHPHVRHRLLGCFVLLAGVVGCNAILDNRPAVLDDSAGSDVDPSDPGSGEAPPGATSSDVPSGSGAPISSACGGGKKACFGGCVSTADTAYGCGVDGCGACKTPHGAPRCEGAGCAVELCDKGYADCNQRAEDGCEVDLSKATSCGGCNVACPAAAPVCVPSGDTFRCGSGCTPAAPLLCGTECVSPLDSANHCGGCNLKCPDVENGTVACAAGQCQFTCRPGFRACGTRCTVPNDPGACGPGCTVCPAIPNAIPTCQADACGFQCEAGFGNCNDLPIDGCEARFESDPRNCGGCGISCGGGACQGGTCVGGDAGAPE